MQQKKLKTMPKFATEAAERAFRESHDSTDYVDWSKSVLGYFPNLKPSTTSISLRLSISTLDRLKIAANKRDVPYQSLLKTWLEEKLKESNQTNPHRGSDFDALLKQEGVLEEVTEKARKRTNAK